MTSTPTGTYYSEELRAYATLTAASGGRPGSATVTIGLARPLTVAAAADGDWAGEGLTLRVLSDGAIVEVSSYGARRTRFSRADGPTPQTQRGLTTPP